MSYYLPTDYVILAIYLSFLVYTGVYVISVIDLGIGLGVKKFALKAQNLYPELDGISQMVMMLDIYISAEEEKLNGESNWYGVLGLTPLVDDETIRKQYRKLALLLHPDKNRSIGAEGAFQFISQAWNLLSDKSKKVAYDQRDIAFDQEIDNERTVAKYFPSALDSLSSSFSFGG
ncbi:Chaperone DnaJ-domain superfamily protein [Perilla frutescens var. hirtella]|nr:Chaperone DnaJ-domain superfamily protein [Perilla frutescens var. hirtella]